jgi:hypothetical protein
MRCRQDGEWYAGRKDVPDMLQWLSPPFAVPGSPQPNSSTLVRSTQVNALESIPVEDRLGLAIACSVNAYAPCIGFVRNRPAGQLISL